MKKNILLLVFLFLGIGLNVQKLKVYSVNDLVIVYNENVERLLLDGEPLNMMNAIVSNKIEASLFSPSREWKEWKEKVDQWFVRFFEKVFKNNKAVRELWKKSVEEKEGNLSLILHFDQEGNIVSSIFYIPLKMYNDKIYNELQKVSNRLLKEKVYVDKTKFKKTSTYGMDVYKIIDMVKKYNMKLE